MGRRFRPDLTGWRCDRMPNPPRAFPLSAPTGSAEIISPEKRRYDVVEKRLYYAEAAILLLAPRLRARYPHGPAARWRSVRPARRGRPAGRATLRPFDLIDIPIARLFPR